MVDNNINEYMYTVSTVILVTIDSIKDSMLFIIVHVNNFEHALSCCAKNRVEKGKIKYSESLAVDIVSEYSDLEIDDDIET